MIEDDEQSIGSTQDEQLLIDEITTNIKTSKNKYEYTINPNNGIKVYNGNIISTKHTILENIAYYNSFIKDSNLEPLNTSILSVGGVINGISFDNESIIHNMPFPTNEKIIKIGCNEKEIYFYPNKYVHYNIANIIDILINKVRYKHKIDIHCNCQDITDSQDYLISLYEKIKKDIDAINTSKIFITIEKYLLGRRQRNKEVIDKIVFKICKKLLLYSFHQKLYKNNNINICIQLFEELKRNPIFERNKDICLFIDMLKKVEELVNFFKCFIERCKCVVQPYDYDSRIHVDATSRDIVSLREHNKEKKKKLIGNTINKKNKKKKRTNAGCGKYFETQITFEIFNDITKKVYKIKVYRNGNFQAPGIKYEDMHDIVGPLMILTKYLEPIFKKELFVESLVSISRSYNSSLKIRQKEVQVQPKKVLYSEIMCDRFNVICRREKTLEYMEPRILCGIYNYYKEFFGNNIARNIMTFMPFTSIKMAEIIINPERYSGIKIKFRSEHGKKISMALSSNCNVVLNCCNSRLEADQLYHWLDYMLDKYYTQIVFDPHSITRYCYESEDSNPGYKSIYDDDIEEHLEICRMEREKNNDLINKYGAQYKMFSSG